MNSLRSVERAVRYEVQRHAAVLTSGRPILQETRHWHEDTGITTSGREKSDAEDYRYFPEPDLVPMAPDKDWVERLRASLPEPPHERRARLQEAWGFSDLEMRDTVGAGALGLVEQTIEAGASPAAARKWWLSELARRANESETDIAALGVSPAEVARVQALVDEGRINDKLARQVFDGLVAGEGTPDEIIEARGLAIVSDDGALSAAVDNAIAANPDVADKIRDGKVAAAGALIGDVMKQMRGQADAGRVRELILEKLDLTELRSTVELRCVRESPRDARPVRDATGRITRRIATRRRAHSTIGRVVGLVRGGSTLSALPTGGTPHNARCRGKPVEVRR